MRDGQATLLRNNEQIIATCCGRFIAPEALGKTLLDLGCWPRWPGLAHGGCFSGLASQVAGNQTHKLVSEKRFAKTKNNLKKNRCLQIQKTRIPDTEQEAS